MMTIPKLLESLQAKRNALDSAIQEILLASQHHTTRTKAKAIMKSVRKKYKPYKPGTHWMQKPENRAKVIAMAKARAKKRLK